MIYFDNAATSSPKPQSVIKAVNRSLTAYAANPGRSAYSSSLAAADEIFGTRSAAARFFGAVDESHIIFTHNCTTALNTVIKGLAVKGSHFVISSLEHNAVVRPLETLKKRGIITYSIAEVTDDDSITEENFRRLINEDTTAVICTGASNVFGKIPPIKRIAKAAHESGTLFILDAAQTAGIIETNITDDGIDYACIAAHKGLYAPMSIGMLIINNERRLKTLTEGGTGNLSSVFTQPEELPERLESGSLSVPLISGLRAGIEFVSAIGIEKIYEHEMGIIRRIFNSLSDMRNIKLYTDPLSHKERFAPVLSFNVASLPSERTAELLSASGIAVRAGFHCAYLAHQSYKTDDFGTVRLAPSVFTNDRDVKILLNSIFKIAKSETV